MGHIFRSAVCFLALGCIYGCTKKPSDPPAPQADGAIDDSSVARDGSGLEVDARIRDAGLPDMASGEGGLTDGGGGLTDGGVAIARRIRHWVCDTSFPPQALLDEPAKFNLATFEGSREFVVLEPAEQPCNFYPVISDAEGRAHRLTQNPSGYLFATTIRVDGVKAVCLNRIDHIEAADQGEPDPNGVMVRRQTEGVAVECAVYLNDRWSPLREVISPRVGWAPWIQKLERVDDSNVRLTYNRDFSLNFMNLTHAGRPETDGTYTIDLSLGADQINIGQPQQVSTRIAGQQPVDPCSVGDQRPDGVPCEPRCGDGRCDPNERCGEFGRLGEFVPDEAECPSDCNYCAVTMDDANIPGFEVLSGEWLYGRGHAEYSRHTVDGTAEYEFKAMVQGWKQLRIHVPSHGDNTDEAIYSILQGEEEIARGRLDQRIDATQWMDMGSFYADGDFTVRVSGRPGARLQADALRVEETPHPGPVFDDSSLLYRELGGPWTTVPGGHADRHRQSVDGEAHFRIPISTGVFELQVHYPAIDGASQRVSYTTSSNGGSGSVV